MSVYGAVYGGGGGVSVPAIGNVRAGVAYGSGGSLIGTLTLPPISQVLSGVQFGAGGVEFTGSLIVTPTSPGDLDYQDRFSAIAGGHALRLLERHGRRVTYRPEGGDEAAGEILCYVSTSPVTRRGLPTAPIAGGGRTRTHESREMIAMVKALGPEEAVIDEAAGVGIDGGVRQLRDRDTIMYPRRLIGLDGEGDAVLVVSERPQLVPPGAHWKAKVHP